MDFPADTIVDLSTSFAMDRLTAAVGLPKENIVNVQTSELNGYVVIEVNEDVDIQALNVDSPALVLFPFSSDNF